MNEPSTPFPYEEVDSIEAQIAERVKSGEPFGDLLEQRDAGMAEIHGARAVRALLGYVRSQSKNPTIAICALSWATGTFYDGMTCRQWAEQFGITYQQFDRMAARLCRELGIKQTRTLRGEQ